MCLSWGAKLTVDLHLLFREGSVSDLAPKSTPHCAGAEANPDPKGAFDPEEAHVESPDLGSIGRYRLIRKLGEGSSP